MLPFNGRRRKYKLPKHPERLLNYILRKLALLGYSKNFSTHVKSADISSDSEVTRYVDAVNMAIKNPRHFENFKRDRRYREILEHVTFEQGMEYYKIFARDSPWMLSYLEDFRKNDELGNPVTYDYPGIGTFSPTTLRYIKVASDLQRYFGDLRGARIAEIGVGYGGQLIIADKVLNFDRYYLFDLPSVLQLVEKYLDEHLLRSSYECLTINQAEKNKTYDLVISNYAFSELPSRLQETYIDKVLSKAKRAYLTMNSGAEQGGANHVNEKVKLSVSELAERLPPFKVLEEDPLTGERNYIIVWGHNGG
jgi:putative sugar O-methyltransferase